MIKTNMKTIGAPNCIQSFCCYNLHLILVCQNIVVNDLLIRKKTYHEHFSLAVKTDLPRNLQSSTYKIQYTMTNMLKTH